jgi:ABC-2 type transport system permease protein
MILLLMPVILIILFGYAITTEIKRVPIAIFDQSRDELTLKMADRLNASEYFELYTTVDSYEDAEALFRQGKVHVIVVFPPGTLPRPMPKYKSWRTLPIRTRRLS